DIRNRRNGHSSLVDLRRAEYQQERRRAAATPAPHADARRVDVRAPLDDTSSGGLVVHSKRADLVEHRLAPISSARTGRAAIIHCRSDLARLREHEVPEPAAPLQLVLHGLVGGLAVYIEEDRILLRGIEVDRPHDPRVELDPTTDVSLRELDRRLLE